MVRGFQRDPLPAALVLRIEPERQDQARPMNRRNRFFPEPDPDQGIALGLRPEWNRLAGLNLGRPRTPKA